MDMGNGCGTKPVEAAGVSNELVDAPFIIPCPPGRNCRRNRSRSRQDRAINNSQGIKLRLKQNAPGIRSFDFDFRGYFCECTKEKSRKPKGLRLFNHLWRSGRETPPLSRKLSVHAAFQPIRTPGPLPRMAHSNWQVSHHCSADSNPGLPFVPATTAPKKWLQTGVLLSLHDHMGHALDTARIGRK